MKKILLSLLALLPMQSFAAETYQIKCAAVPFKNSATIEGSLNLESKSEGAAVSGTLNLTLKRVGDRYAPESLGNVSVSGEAVVVESLPDSEGGTNSWIAVKLNSASQDRIQFLSLNLNLPTVNADSWVRTDDGVKYFANCQVVP